MCIGGFWDTLVSWSCFESITEDADVCWCVCVCMHRHCARMSVCSCLWLCACMHVREYCACVLVALGHSVQLVLLWVHHWRRWRLCVFACIHHVVLSWVFVLACEFVHARMSKQALRVYWCLLGHWITDLLRSPSLKTLTFIDVCLCIRVYGSLCHSQWSSWNFVTLSLWICRTKDSTAVVMGSNTEQANISLGFTVVDHAWDHCSCAWDAAMWYLPVHCFVFYWSISVPVIVELWNEAFA